MHVYDFFSDSLSLNESGIDFGVGDKIAID